MEILKEFQFTDEGYIKSHDIYIGMRDDNEWDWLSNYDMCKSCLKPIINMAAIHDIKRYLECKKKSV